MAKRKTASTSATTKRKKITNKKTTSPKATKRSGQAKRVKVTPKAKVVSAPIMPAVTVLTPTLPTITTPTVTRSTYKEVRHTTGTPTKLWLAVSVTTLVITGIWVWSLSSRFSHSNALEETIAATNISEFVTGVSQDFNELKTSTDELNTTLGTVANTNTNSTVQPNNEQLDNLFSDLQ